MLINFAYGILFALIISIVSFKLKFLTIDGTASQFLLAVIIFTFGGWKWTVPILTFFILSSLLSKIKIKSKNYAESYFEKTGKRDSMQVLANGGIGGILVMLNQIFPSELLYSFYVSSIAAVCADTWGTEIGTMFNAKTVSMFNFRRVDRGTSGGISVPGTIGSMLGAFIIPLSSLSWISIKIFSFIFAVALSGFGGSIVDGLIGGSIQAQYKCYICGKITEQKIHCGAAAPLAKGFRWLNNDAVNLIAALSGCVIFFSINEFFKV